MPSTAAALKRKAKVYDSPEELALVHRAKRGNQEAFTQLYSHHLNRVRVTINRIVKDEDASDWLSNVALTKVWENLRGWTIREGKRVKTAGFNEQSKFSTWITRIAINEGLMYIRSQKTARRDAESATLDIMLSPQGGYNTEGAYENKRNQNEKILSVRDLELEGIADRQVLAAALVRVPLRYREVIRLRYWEGYSIAEIKKELSQGEEKLSVPAIKTRLLRGRLILKNQVNRIS